MRIDWIGGALALMLAVGCTARQFRLEPTGAGQGLSRVTSDEVSEFGPAVSPDGRTLLFDTRRSGEPVIIGVDPTSGARRTVFTARTSGAEQAGYAPQGSWFVYSSNSPGSWSLVRSLSNSANAAVSIIVSGENAPLASDPDISPDGQRVAFGTYIRNGWNIGIANIDGSNLTLFGEGSNPAWNPDGSRLAFVRMAGGRAHIFTIDVASGANVVQVTQGESDNVDPAWSPDGNLIVFSSNRSGGRAPKGYDVRTRLVRGRFNLYTIRADGTNLVQMTDGDAMSLQPAWGRDGFIYFASNQVGNFDIWRLRPSPEVWTDGAR